jgi:Zn finger protein HypA/HybF involved in hydrogenase expression
MYDRLRRELSYVNGLLEGSSTNNSLEAKAFERLISVVDELVDAGQKLDIRQTELEEYTEAIDEDLNDLELLFYDEDEEDTLLFNCPECKEDIKIDLGDLEDDEIDLLCPNCHTVLTVEDDTDTELLNSRIEEG